MVGSYHRPIGGNDLDIQSIDGVKLFGLGGGRTGHAADLGVERDQILQRDGSEDPALGLLREAFLRFNGRVQARRPAPVLRDLPDNSSVYFVHSYYVRPKDASIIATETDYPTPFASAIWQDNVFATQFHPEKSQKVGLAMLQNFARL